MQRIVSAAGILALALVVGALAAPPEPERAARLAAGIEETTRALATAPVAQQKDLYLRRAAFNSLAGHHDRAVEDLDRVLGSDPLFAQAYDERGSEQFMLGQVDRAIEDFDRAVHLQPNRARGHWKRGIAYYYANRNDEGRQQFESYQTVDANDVENAVWRFLCMARGEGLEAARAGILKIDRDARVPMMTIYQMFGGQATADDVLAAVRAGSPAPNALNERLFYAHLYLGLYADATGEADAAREHLTTAVRDHKIDHYMWNVADVHLKRLEQAPAKR